MTKKNVLRVYRTGSVSGYSYNEELVKPPTKKYVVKVERKNCVFYLDEFCRPCDFSNAMTLTEDCANRICQKLRMKGYCAYAFSTSKL